MAVLLVRWMVYPKFSKRMDIPPKTKTKISFFESFSLKIIAADTVESRITPMLSVGKNIALSSRPASRVLSRLQQPKNAPTKAATVLLRARRTSVSDPVLLVISADSEDIPAAIKNAIRRNIGL